MIMATPLQCKAAYWTNDFNQTDQNEEK
jgi:hypothetical protein